MPVRVVCMGIIEDTWRRVGNNMKAAVGLMPCDLGLY